MTDIAKALFEVHGVLALGWVCSSVLTVAIVAMFRMWRGDIKHRDELHSKDLREIAKVMERNGESFSKVRELVVVMMERLRNGTS